MIPTRSRSSQVKWVELRPRSSCWPSRATSPGSFAPTSTDKTNQQGTEGTRGASPSSTTRHLRTTLRASPTASRASVGCFARSGTRGTCAERAPPPLVSVDTQSEDAQKRSLKHEEEWNERLLGGQNTRTWLLLRTRAISPISFQTNTC